MLTGLIDSFHSVVCKFHVRVLYWIEVVHTCFLPIMTRKQLLLFPNAFRNTLWSNRIESMHIQANRQPHHHSRNDDKIPASCWCNFKRRGTCTLHRSHYTYRTVDVDDRRRIHVDAMRIWSSSFCWLGLGVKYQNATSSIYPKAIGEV